ncbi:hypothetical protein ASF26_03735 [Methylobacterium sp. Leaf93]|nr:hypothetical protein ASF26_03735 [Methylobacterium sp. Leaf93]
MTDTTRGDRAHAASAAGGAGNRLSSMNTMLAEWAAGAACKSDTLIERFEQMGYSVRGKTKEEIEEVLRCPPTGPEGRT